MLVIIKMTGPCSYLVKGNDGIVLQRHIDQLRSRYSLGVDYSQSNDTEDCPLPRTSLTAPVVGNTDTSVNISESESIDPPRLDGQPSPQYTPAVPIALGLPPPTHPIH